MRDERFGSRRKASRGEIVTTLGNWARLISRETSCRRGHTWANVYVAARRGARLVLWYWCARSRLFFPRDSLFIVLCVPGKAAGRAPVLSSGLFSTGDFPSIAEPYRRASNGLLQTTRNCSQFMPGMQSATRRHPQSPNAISSPIKHRRPTDL